MTESFEIEIFEASIWNEDKIESHLRNLYLHKVNLTFTGTVESLLRLDKIFDRVIKDLGIQNTQIN